VYEKGDYVICASGGVWRVIDTGSDKIHLGAHESGEEMILAAENAEIIRKIVSKQEILDVIGRVGYIRTIQAPNEKFRRVLYEDAMAKYDELEWVKVIKSVYLRRQDGRLMSGESEYGEKAKTYLHSEISVLLGIPTDKVEKHIASVVSDDSW
jgi:hypothetical protein